MRLDHYGLDDFLMDESFQNWVLNKGPASEQRFWEQWILDHPEKKVIAEEAVHVIKLFQNTFDERNDVDIPVAWCHFKAKLEDQQKLELKSGWWNMRFYRYAASVALIIVFIFTFFIWRSTEEIEYITYRTNYGETQEVTLPDNSVVTLNANSQLKFNVDWDHDNRTVWMEKGEAFFDIKKDNQASFTVHTDQLDVIVLGTKFNINLRGKTKNVMLQEGKVKLDLSNGEAAFIKPGDLAKYKSGSELSIVRVNPADYNSWMKGKVVFGNATLIDIGDYIEAQYGIKVQIHRDLQNRALSGKLPTDNLTLLLETISTALDVTIQRGDNEIIISK